jgi:hypothetical protein
MLKRSVQALAVSTLVLCALTAGASAQSILTTRKVSIDFDFYAGKKLMPAGDYEFKLTGNNQAQGLVQVRNVNTGAVMILPSLGNRNTKIVRPGSIVFNKYGDQYYLSRLHLGDADNVQEIIKGKTERKLFRNIIANTSNDQIIVPTTGR